MILPKWMQQIIWFLLTVLDYILLPVWIICYLIADRFETVDEYANEESR